MIAPSQIVAGLSLRVWCLTSSAVLFFVFQASGQLLDQRSQKDMEALLAEIHARVNDDNGFFGDSKLRAYRERVSELDIRKEPGPYLQATTYLGSAMVDQGHLEEGIKTLTTAYQLVGQLSGPDSMRGEVIAELGNAYLRLAESENCCAFHSPESCIVPLLGAAIHKERRGSESAIKYFKEVIQLKEIDPYLRMKCVWLMNIAYMTLGEYPQNIPKGMGIPPSAFSSRIRFPKFPNIAGALGIDQFNLAGGAVLDDFDGDHDLDLITSCWDTSAPMSFHENLGNGSFKDRSEEAGLLPMLGGLNIVQADYDNDGDLDLYVLRGAWMRAKGVHPNSLLQNQGDGTFIDRTFESGLGNTHRPTQTAAWADYDNDGDLDLYVGNESHPTFAAPCQLFQNRGDGTFVDVASQAGVTNDRFTKGVVWGDIDGDRFPDIVVSNLGEKNRLYRNQADGTFKDIAAEAGVELPLASFPAWTWDFDNDGNLDVFISSYGAEVGDFVLHYIGQPIKKEKPGHYTGNGQGKFTNVAKAHGLELPMLPMGANYGDLNNDGFLDFYLGTGEPSISVILPNAMFLNKRGQGFIDVTMSGGFGHLQKGHAIAFADFDEDGDQDIFEQMGGAKPVDKYRDAFYQNPGFGNQWLKVKLVGKTSNRSGIGARIHALIKEGAKWRSIYRHVGSGASFGANPLRQHIGTGKATEIFRLEVFWPTSNTTQVFENVSVGQFIEVTEGDSSFKVIRSHKS
ncbi:MAG: CRTAC1 family protein [Verrucomicrobiales bacterium]|jgi:hypothetical protein|nr:CRTAC1 family protein [Verrucomicrobiales bacterium]